MKLNFASSLLCATIAAFGATLHAAQVAPAAQAATAQAPANPLPIRAANVRGANYFPNCELVTHEGKKVKYFDDLLAGKTVIVNFIYTTCPDACPMASAKLAEVQELFKDRMGKDVFFYSISVDPEVDTPEVLAQYAKRFNAGPGWLFLTGKKSDIREVRKKMGMLRADEENKEQHTLDMLIGNQATGVWVKRSTMDNPYSIANQVEGKALGWKTARTVEAETIAPRVRKYEAGEDIFRSRCSTCHIIGKDDGLPKQGPNLLGVVDRRDRKWLERWILEPDVMLALKDPLAMDLYNAWHQLPMPNMRLTPLEVQGVIGYMDRTSDAYIEELRAKEAQANSDWAAADTADQGEEPSDDELLAPLGAATKKAGATASFPRSWSLRRASRNQRPPRVVAARATRAWSATRSSRRRPPPSRRRSMRTASASMASRRLCRLAAARTSWPMKPLPVTPRPPTRRPTRSWRRDPATASPPPSAPSCPTRSWPRVCSDWPASGCSACCASARARPDGTRASAFHPSTKRKSRPDAIVRPRRLRGRYRGARLARRRCARLWLAVSALAWDRRHETTRNAWLPRCGWRRRQALGRLRAAR
jgi:protein SCO1/2